AGLGVGADATANGVEVCALDCWAMIDCAGLAAGAGDSSFCFFATLRPFGDGVALASFSLFAGIGVTAGASTGLACSTRTSSFWAGGGVALALNPGTGTGPPWVVAIFCR